MKIHIDLPWGGVLHIEKEKTEPEILALALFIIPITAIIISMFR